MSLKLLQTIAAAFTRASSAYKKDGTSVGNNVVRYENIAQGVTINKQRLWDAGTHNRTAASGNVLTVGVVPTFTRSTSGWVDGVAVAVNEPRYVAPVNLLTSVNDLSNASWVKTVGTITANATTDPDGGNEADLAVGAGAFSQCVFEQSFTPVAHTVPYTFTFYVKFADADSVAFVTYDSSGANPMSCTVGPDGAFSISEGDGGSESVGNGWYKVWGTTNTAYTDNLTKVEVGTAYGNAYFYGFNFHKGNTNGNTSAGIILEETTTNLILQSSNMTNAAWTPQAITRATGFLAPDGSTSATKLIEDSSAINHTVSQTLSITSGSTYTFSAYLKAGERQYAEIDFGSYVSWVGAAPYALFNLSNGTVGIVGSGVTAKIEHVGNGWYRCSITAVASATNAAASVRIYVSNSPSTPTYTGDGSSGIYAWGAQVEAKPYATSYIPTTSVSVTRNPDLLSYSGASSILNAASGTIIARVYVSGDMLGNSNKMHYILSHEDVGATNRIMLRKTGTNWLAIISSEVSGTSVSASWVSDLTEGWHTIAMRWTPTTIQLWANGTQKATQSKSVMPGYFGSRVYIGSVADTSSNLNGIINWIDVFNANLSDADMALYTASSGALIPKRSEHTLKLNFNNTLTTEIDSVWTSPWYDSTASGCVWESFAANKTTPSGTINTLEFRTALDASGTGASAWTTSLPATGQYIQAKVTLNPQGQATHPSVTDITITPADLGKGIVIEEATTNLFAAPTAPVSENVTVTANGDYTLSIYGNDTSSGSVVITHEKVEDSQADFNTGTLVGVTALASGAIALDVQADPTFTRATVATKKDFTQVTSGNARFEELVTPFTLDLQHQFDAGTKEGVTTSSGAVTVDFTPTFTRASTATNKKLEVIPSGQIRYDDLVAPITLDTQFDWENSGTKDSILTTASSGDLTMINGTPTFTRATVAYKKNGTQVASGAARYEQGKNLLTKNQSDSEDGLGGMAVNGTGAVSRTSDWSYDGVYSVMATANGSSNWVACNNIPITSGLTYTGSAYVKNPGVSSITVSITISGANVSGYVIPAGQTVRVSTAWTATITSTGATLRFFSNSASSFYIDNIQFEESSSATTWVPGGQSAIMIEEGTTNILTANMSSVETDTTGFSVTGTTSIARVTTWAYEGTASLEVTNATNASNSVQIGSFSVTSGLVYTFQARIKNPGASSITVNGGMSGSNHGNVTIPPGGVALFVASNTPASTVSTQYRFWEATGQTFQVDAMQLEQKSYPTSWQIGGTARANETLMLPTNIINLSQGTIIVRACIDAQFASNAAGLQYMLWHADGSSRNRILIRKNGSVLECQVMNDAGTSSFANWNTYVLTAGWHTFAVRYSSNELSLWIDGVKRGLNTAAINLPQVTCNTWVGGPAGGQSNALIDSFDVFHEALSDSDMATLTQI